MAKCEARNEQGRGKGIVVTSRTARARNKQTSCHISREEHLHLIEIESIRREILVLECISSTEHSQIIFSHSFSPEKWENSWTAKCRTNQQESISLDKAKIKVVKKNYTTEYIKSNYNVYVDDIFSRNQSANDNNIFTCKLEINVEI